MKDHRRAGMPSPYPAAIPRRIVTITIAWVLFFGAVLLAPVAGLLAVATDLVRRRPGWPTVRLAAMILRFLWIEVSAHLVILWSWVSQPFVKQTWTERNHELMHWWCGRLTRGAERVVGVRWDFDIPEDLGPGPLLAFAQHVFAKAKPGYHPITTGSVQAVIDEAAAKSAATPAGAGTPSAGQTATAPESLHPSDPVPMPAETR